MAEVSPAVASKAARLTLPWAVKGLLAASVLLMGVGIATPILMPTSPQPAPARVVGPPAPSGMNGFAGDTTSPTPPPSAAPAAEPAPGTLAAWSPTIFSLGFSFFVGFALAFALRTFLRFALIGIGFFFLVMFGLQYAGLVEVRWSAMEAKYNELTAGMDAKARSAMDYVGTYLPSAASATAGMVAGFWRRK